MFVLVEKYGIYTCLVMIPCLMQRVVRLLDGKHSHKDYEHRNDPTVSVRSDVHTF